MSYKNPSLRGEVLKHGWQSKRNNSDLVQKATIRVETMRRLEPNDTDLWYAPYCGYLDVAKIARYPMERLLALDVDLDAIDHCRATYPQARVVADSVVTFTDFGDQKYCFADFDPWSQPYKAILMFRNSANLADRLGIIMTDGVGKKMLRGGWMFNPWTGMYTENRPATARAWYENYAHETRTFLSQLFERDVIWSKHIDGPRLMKYSGFILDKK